MKLNFIKLKIKLKPLALSAIGSLFFSSLVSGTLAVAPAQACPSPRNFPGGERSPLYMRRDDNRCEGIRNRDTSASIELISFVTTNLQNNYGDTLTIRVPGAERDRPPEILIQSFSSAYRLDQLNTQYGTNGFMFPLKTVLLREARVDPGSLRATAAVLQGGRKIFYPVVLGSPSGSYQLVISVPNPTQIRAIEILRNNRPVQSSTYRAIQDGHLAITWNYRGQARGTYLVRVSFSQNGQNVQRTFTIQHDPAWF